MRVLLIGGTDLTVAAGNRLSESGVEIAGAVYVPKAFDISYQTTPLQSTRFADVKAWCRARKIPSRKYSGAATIVDLAKETGADFGLAAGWYHMIPRHVRDVFAKGCAGLHGSLLPKFRGGAPLAWAILAGERKTGMTLFELGDGIDDGPIYGQRSFEIGPRARVGDLVVAAEAAALELIAECMPRIAKGTLAPRAQSGSPTYGLQRAPGDGRIDWHASAVSIDRLVRAVGRPYPGASTTFAGEDVLIWDAAPLSGVTIFGSPGQIAKVPEEPMPCVVTGDGVLVVHDATNRSGQSLMALLHKAANQRFA